VGTELKKKDTVKKTEARRREKKKPQAADG